MKRAHKFVKKQAKKLKARGVSGQGEVGMFSHSVRRALKLCVKGLKRLLRMWMKMGVLDQLLPISNSFLLLTLCVEKLFGIIRQKCADPNPDQVQYMETRTIQLERKQRKFKESRTRDVLSYVVPENVATPEQLLCQVGERKKRDRAVKSAEEKTASMEETSLLYSVARTFGGLNCARPTDRAKEQSGSGPGLFVMLEGVNEPQEPREVFGSFPSLFNLLNF